MSSKPSFPIGLFVRTVLPTLMFLFCSSAAIAQSAGDWCGTYGLTTGAAIQTNGRFLVCGAASPYNLFSYLDYTTSGNVLFQFDNDAGTCTAVKTGRIIYTGTAWQYCNGTTWSAFP